MLSMNTGASSGSRAALYCACAISALMVVGDAAAAEADAPVKDASVVDELVVTAQRREQTILDVPISVEVVSAKQIERSAWVGAKQYTQIAPNVFFNENDSQSSKNGDVSIRGISDLTSGSNNRGILSRPSIGIYVDDFSVGNVAGGSANPPLADLERIEILRGPQSVYFGRAAEGGAINIVSRKPQDENSLRLMGGVGNFNAFTAGGIVNHVLTDGLFFRGGLSYEQGDGFVENLHPNGTSTDYTRINGRAALRWRAGEWTIDGMAQVISEHEGNLGKIPTGVSPSGFIGRGTGGAFTPIATCGLGRDIIMTQGGGNQRRNCENTPAFTDIENVVTTLRAEHAGEKFTFTSLTGRIASDYSQLEDIDNTGADIFSRSNDYHTISLSQEFRLSSNEDQYQVMGRPLDWTLGAFAYRDRTRQANQIVTGVDSAPNLLFLTVPGDRPNENNQRVKRDGYAVFLDTTLHLTDSLTLSIGARYSHDEDEQVWTNTFASFDCPTRQVVGGVIPPLAAGCSLRPSSTPLVIHTDAAGNRIVTGGRYAQTAWTQGKSTSNDFSPRVALNWRPTEDQSFYATYAEGYNPAGIRVAPDAATRQQTIGALPLPDNRSVYKSSIVTNYEAGWRGFFNERKILLEAAVFRMEWRNMQFRLDRTLCRLPSGEYVPQDGPQGGQCDPAGGFVPQNAVLNAKAARSQGVELTFEDTINEYFSFGGAVGYLDAKYTDFRNAPANLGPVNRRGDLSGLRLPNSPRWSAAAHATVNWDVGESEWYATLTGTYKGRTYVNFDSIDQTTWPRGGRSITLFNLSAGVTWRENQVNLAVENLFDKQYVIGVEGLSGSGIVTNVHPRVITLTWSRKFGG